MHGPGMDFYQRIILVIKPDQALVAVKCCRKKLLMHASAVRALQVVEIDDRDFGVLGPPQRAALGRDHLRWTMTDIKPLQTRNRVAVAGKKKIHHRLLALRRE